MPASAPTSSRARQAFTRVAVTAGLAVLALLPSVAASTAAAGDGPTVRKHLISPTDSVVVPAGSTVRRRAAVGPGIARVTLTVVHGAGPASVRVRAGSIKRRNGRAHNARSRVVRLRGDQRSRRIRLRVSVRHPQMRVAVRVGGTAVRVRRLSLSANPTPRENKGVRRPGKKKQPPASPPPAQQPPAPAPSPEPSPAPAPAPAPAPSPPPAPSPSPAPDFTTLVWADEFSGAAGAPPRNDRWMHEVGGHGWGNGELQTFTNRTANSVHDGGGDLDLIARRERFTGQDGYTRDYTSARIITKGRFAFTYGKVEARIKSPAGTGLWPIFWMMGDDVWDIGWPLCGEVDIMEMVGNDPATGPWNTACPALRRPAVGERRLVHSRDAADRRLPRLHDQMVGRGHRVAGRRRALPPGPSIRDPRHRPVGLQQTLPSDSVPVGWRQLARGPERADPVPRDDERRLGTRLPVVRQGDQRNTRASPSTRTRLKFSSSGNALSRASNEPAGTMPYSSR